MNALKAVFRTTATRASLMVAAVAFIAMASEDNGLTLARAMDRWFTIPPAAMYHPAQMAWHSSRARFNIVPAGRRSYKTERAKRKLVLGTPFYGPPTHRGAIHIPDGRFFAGAPTQDQAEAIYWEDLKALCRPYTRSISKSEHYIELMNGARIYVLGLDRPERAEGRIWHGFVLDEFANMKKGTWGEHLQPMTADMGAWVDFIGVPDYRGPNMEEYKKLYDKAIAGNDPDWAVHQWSSEGILPDEAIAEAKRTLTGNLYEQEYCGGIISAPGRAYYEFQERLHLKPQTFNTDAGIHVACDFNRGHHNWLVAQVTDDVFRIIRQVYLQNATVEQMCTALASMIASNHLSGVVNFYGDYSGDSKTATSTYSAWGQIKRKFPQAKYHYRSQGAIADRVDRVNVTLCNAIGESHVAIDPHCEELAKDLQFVTMDMLYSQQKTGERTHASDALGYLIDQYTRLHRVSTVTREQLSRFSNI